MGNFNYLHIIDDSQPKVSKKTPTYSRALKNLLNSFMSKNNAHM